MITKKWSSGQASKGFNYVADFETTTDPDDCRVWLWMLCDVEDTDYLPYGKDVKSFCDFVAGMPNCHIYFHNLAFDGAFILDFLLNQGYVHVSDSPRKRQFSTLISNMGKFYNITVRWENGTLTEFRDSLKKLPMSVKNVAETFKLSETKGEIDYHDYRPVGYAATADELSYITNDVKIIAHALRRQFSQGMTRLTVGSDALAEYKRLSGDMFKKLFPVLPETMDADIRRSYRGGFTYRDDRYKNCLVGEGNVFDVNSLYPSVMYSCAMPYGEPIWFDDAPDFNDPHYPLFVVSITFVATLRDNHIPCIQVKGSMLHIATEYQTVIDDPVTLSCTNIDLALWQEHYDLEVLSYNGGWKFHSIYGLFNDYIDKWNEVKASSDGGLRAIAKLHLNSLYGKFATNPDVTPKIPVLGEDGVVRLVMGSEETREPVYTAVGSFITAYAREVTIRAAQVNYGTFAYADTDSLHLITDEPLGLTVDPVKLGAWKHEYRFVAARYVRAKCYVEQIDGPWVAKHGAYVARVAGLPESISDALTISDFETNRVFKGKLAPKRVRGGIVLSDVDFTLTITE